MDMKMIAVQYLEDGPHVAAIEPEDAQARLRAAFERLPIATVLLGWNLPSAVVSGCREEADQAGAQLFRWHPLLTGDGVFMPRPEWQAVGLRGERVPGFRGMPEFTFVCPNRPAVREAVLARLHDAIRGGDYQGVFLDRIRYPSPAADPTRWLACFCDDCRRIAATEGLDLAATRRQIMALLKTPERTLAFLRMLLDPSLPENERGTSDPDLAALCAFLDFRARSVTRIIRDAADLIQTEGLSVGLDCFSPALTRMVGQDLGELDPCCEWIKIMSYGHAFGPAGLPFELLDLASWLVGRRVVGGREALERLSLATHLPLPPTQMTLRRDGLSPDALGAEVGRGHSMGIRKLLAGIELVELAGVTSLNMEQIAADLRAFQEAGADGLALSWDLWYIPLERLELVRTVWFDD